MYYDGCIHCAQVSPLLALFVMTGNMIRWVCNIEVCTRVTRMHGRCPHQFLARPGSVISHPSMSFLSNLIPVYTPAAASSAFRINVAKKRGSLTNSPARMNSLVVCALFRLSTRLIGVKRYMFFVRAQKNLVSVFAGIKYGVTMSSSSFSSGRSVFLIVPDRTRQDSLSSGDTGAGYSASTP